MLNLMSDLEFTFVCCEQHKEWRLSALGIHIQNSPGVGNKTKVSVTGGGGMAAYRRKEKAVRRHIKLPNEHFSHAYPAPYIRANPPSQQIRTSIVSWPKDAMLYIHR